MPLVRLTAGLVAMLRMLLLSLCTDHTRFLADEKKYWFWEVVVMCVGATVAHTLLRTSHCMWLCRRIRKMLLAFTVVLLSTMPHVQLVTALGVTISAMVMHNAVKPYESPKTDQLESFALLVQTVTLLLGQVRLLVATYTIHAALSPLFMALPLAVLPNRRHAIVAAYCTVCHHCFHQRAVLPVRCFPLVGSLA